jgi:hypothetical protein
MKNVTLAAFAAFLAMSAAAEAAEHTYEVDHWPADIDTIPCSAWTKTSDGAWTLNGAVKIGASVIENVGFKNDTSARAIEKKCGKK